MSFKQAMSIEMSAQVMLCNEVKLLIEGTQLGEISTGLLFMVAINNIIQICYSKVGFDNREMFQKVRLLVANSRIGSLSPKMDHD